MELYELSENGKTDNVDIGGGTEKAFPDRHVETAV